MIEARYLAILRKEGSPNDRPVGKRERSYRFDIRQFQRMVAAGIFQDQKVELVAGRIYPMTDLPPHTFALETFHESFERCSLAIGGPCAKRNPF